MEKLTQFHENIYIQYNLEAARLLNYYRFKDKKLVFTNGCFDIIHRGHIEYLKKAAELGDVLIVGLNADESVKRLKGINRPINDQFSRALLLQSLRFVDAVIIFNEDTPEILINQILPDILIKGGDYTDLSKIVGYKTVINNGGKVLTIPFVDGYSSTNIINQTKKE